MQVLKKSFTNESNTNPLINNPYPKEEILSLEPLALDMKKAADSIVHLQNARAVQTLPINIKHWLENATEALLDEFEKEYPHKDSINREDMAASHNIQNILHQQGEKLYTCPEFDPSLSGKFIISRVTSQPKDSAVEKPSFTHAGFKIAAFHAAAGLAEVICKNTINWKTALDNLNS